MLLAFVPYGSLYFLFRTPLFRLSSIFFVLVRSGWQDSRNDSKQAVVFANGDALAERDVRTVERIMNEIKVSIPWRNGDVILIDNKQVMHSRHTFTGPRQIYAILLK